MSNLKMAVLTYIIWKKRSFVHNGIHFIAHNLSSHSYLYCFHCFKPNQIERMTKIDIRIEEFEITIALDKHTVSNFASNESNPNIYESMSLGKNEKNRETYAE